MPIRSVDSLAINLSSVDRMYLASSRNSASDETISHVAFASSVVQNGGYSSTSRDLVSPTPSTMRELTRGKPKRDTLPSYAEASHSSHADPPSYEVATNEAEPPPGIPEDLTARLANLDLHSRLKEKPLITEDHCVAHLKLLEAFYRLRQDISERNGLFDIAEHDAVVHDGCNKQTIKRAQRVREKRWEVYVARAVDRFQKWWEQCIPATLNGEPSGPMTLKNLGAEGIEKIATMAVPLQWSEEDLPPLG
jgi:hypothetical protein